MRSGPTGSPRFRTALIEAAAVVAVVAAAVILLGFVVGTGWRDIFFRDGDSLALPLLAQSIAEGRPFAWVMTSQLFAFPEIPVFAVALVLAGGSAAGALVVNAVLNVVMFYGVLRLLGSGLLPPSRGLRLGAALGGTVVLLLLSATEGRALNNEGALATTFLFTTYYYGAVLVGLFCLALVARTVKSPERLRSTSVIVGLATAATTFSNPLLLVQFVAPVGIVLGLLLLLGLLGRRPVLVVGVTILGSAVAGYLLRGAVGGLIGTDAAGYLRLPLAGTALDDLIVQFLVVKIPVIGKLEVLALGLLMAAAVATLLNGVAGIARARPVRDIDRARLTVSAFVVVQTVVLLLVQVFTGSSVTRYLMPLALSASAMVVVLAGSPVVGRVVRPLVRPDRRPSHRRIVVVAGAATSIALLGASVPSGLRVAAAATAATDDRDADCLVDWIDGRSLSGVGSFWSTRPLELYGPEVVDVQQVDFDFTVQLWMNNLSDYEGKTYSYVLVDHEPDWASLTRGRFGDPAAVVGCGRFDIYDYAGTEGEKLLNDIVKTSAEEERDERGY